MKASSRRPQRRKLIKLLAGVPILRAPLFRAAASGGSILDASLLGSSMAAMLGAASPAHAESLLKIGPPEAFSYEALKRTAAELSRQPYQPPPRPDPEIVSKITYDVHGKLKFRPEAALFGDGAGAYPITFLHVGKFFPKTVRMYAVSDGQAREIIYDPRYFTISEDHIAHRLPPKPSAFAGFWVRESRNGPDWREREPWVTFSGASYFRAVGELGQVGSSARGIAIAPGDSAEEFPDFIAFWFEPAPTDTDPVTVYALLNGPSLTGVYRFLLKRTRGVVMEVEATLCPRRSIPRLGVAPLTSMFWFSETSKPEAVDWRPEVHDADGLALWTGTGERIWRPLNNPPRASFSSFADEHPKGYGLLQSDRNFDHYLDGVRYQLRPSVWVEPLGDWGKGAVQLVELPTDDEIHDNITAMWTPAAPVGAGQTLAFAYRLHWLADQPYPSSMARCVATRMGNGGIPGLPRPKGVRKFMVEFLGGPLEKLPFGVKPEPVLWASRGTFSYIYTEAVPDDVPGHWRAQFDLTVTGAKPVELRLYLKNGTEILTDTWLYQYHPG